MTTSTEELLPDTSWWMQIPQFDAEAGLEQWAQEFAPNVAKDQRCADDPDMVAFIATVLRVVADTPYTENFPYRMLCMPDARRGSIMFDVGAFYVEEGERLVDAHRRLLGADDPGGSHGMQTDLIYGRTDDDVIGLQVIRFNLAEPVARSGACSEQSLEAYFSCAIRRDDAPGGPVDLLAIAKTTDIEFLMEALVPAHIMLLSNAVFEAP